MSRTNEGSTLKFLLLPLLMAVMSQYVRAQGPVTTTSGSPPTSLPSTTSITMSAGDSNPNAGSVAWGDGTGWLLNYGPVIQGTFRRRILFSDTGTIILTAGAGATPGYANASSLQIGGGGGNPNAGSVAFGDGTGWLMNYGPVISGTFSPRIVFSDTGAIITTHGYGAVPGFSSPAASIQIGGGGTNPNAGSIAFGDGTGWKLNFGNIRSGVFNPQITFLDTGSLGIGTSNPSAALDVNGQIHSSGGIVFPDGSLQTKAQAVGPQGPPGPPGPAGPTGPVGAPPFGICSSQNSSPVSCSCSTLLSERQVSGGATCSTAGLSTNCSATTQGGSGIPTTFGVCCACK